MSFSWIRGRRLGTLTVDGVTTNYTYDDNGIRTSKTVGNSKTTYYLNGSSIQTQICGSTRLDFLYDEQGIVIGFKYNNGIYLYQKNLQGDIIGIRNSAGTTVVEYSYDSWGKLLEIEGSEAETIGTLNPFRYRGYYYDNESGLYYLNSRYYDAEVGRFVNPDAMETLTADCEDLTQYNLYVYCWNNPINMIDDKGYFSAFIVGALVGAATVYVADVIGNVMSGKSGWDILKPTSSVGIYLGAAVSGMIPGAGVVCAISRIVLNVGVKHSVDSMIEKKKVQSTDVVSDVVTGVMAETVSTVVNYGVNVCLDKWRPQNYSSFRYQMVRRFPQITQQQTRQLMYKSHHIIDAVSIGIEKA